MSAKKSISWLIIIFILYTVLGFAPQQVSAAENEMDWNKVDWSGFDWKLIDEGDNWGSLQLWLENEVGFEQLFLVRQNCAHAAFADTIAVVMSERFMDNPQAMLCAIDKVEEADQKSIIGAIVLGAVDQNELAGALEDVTITGQNTEGEYAVLKEIIEIAKEEFNLEISIPQTGDPIFAASTLFIFCCIFGTVLISKRKK